MKIKEFNEPVHPDTYEASMALNQLMRIGKHAIKLHKLIDDRAEMESWVQKKIDLAGDYVKKVHNYMQGQDSGLYDDDGMTEDAGEGHMSKSVLYHTAKYAIELASMIKPGDDLEGWVQSKLNKAADYLQGAYNYEEYQKLNPYREELDSNILSKHAQVIQKHIDEILARDTKLDDIDTKPGMMRILNKRVNEVEKELAKENRKETNEKAPPGREDQVKKLKTKFKDKSAPYAIAWAQHNKHGKPKNEAELEEGLKDWAKKLAAAGIIVGAVAGMGSINKALDNSVPAIQAMNTALEMATDAGNTELAKMIEKDISDAKLRLDTGKDLNHVKYLQDKYSKFMPTEGLAYKSKLAIMLNQQLK